LFATTNHIERLDPALSRPGRMDVWVNFTHATKWQAEGIFKCFFPYKPSSSVATPASSSTKDASQQNLPLPKRKAFTHAIPILTEDEISELAKRFAEAIPEDELSVSKKETIRIHAVDTNFFPLFIFSVGCWPSRLFVEEQDPSS
jgi:chaperone BCS1